MKTGMLALMLMVFAGEVLAQGFYNQRICTSREAILDGLKGEYRETPSSIALTSEGEVIEVFTSMRGETWTIVITNPNGMSCIMAKGAAWSNFSNDPEA